LSDRSPSAQDLTIMMTEIVGSAALRRIGATGMPTTFWDSRHRSCMTRSSLRWPSANTLVGPRLDIKRLEQHPSGIVNVV
jgi:hypothetical protein